MTLEHGEKTLHIISGPKQNEFLFSLDKRGNGDYPVSFILETRCFHRIRLFVRRAEALDGLRWQMGLILPSRIHVPRDLISMSKEVVSIVKETFEPQFDVFIGNYNPQTNEGSMSFRAYQIAEFIKQAQANNGVLS